jgi:hypothetical protein
VRSLAFQTAQPAIRMPRPGDIGRQVVTAMLEGGISGDMALDERGYQVRIIVGGIGNVGIMVAASMCAVFCVSELNTSARVSRQGAGQDRSIPFLCCAASRSSALRFWASRHALVDQVSHGYDLAACQIGRIQIDVSKRGQSP